MRRFVMLILFAVCGAIVAVPTNIAAAESQLSPAITSDTVCLIQWNGEESWTAYKKTASYQAFFESGLAPALISQIPQLAWQQFLSSVGPFAELPPGLELSNVSSVLMPAWTNGGILALGGQANEAAVAPYFVLVVRDGANGYPIINTLAKTLLESVEKEVQLTEAQLSGHKVLRYSSDDQEVACWSEGKDLVFFYGFKLSDKHATVERLLTAAAGDLLDQQPAWRDAWSEEPIPTDSVRLWMNVRQLVAIGRQLTDDADESGPLQSFLAFTGIDQWQTFAFGTGCHGKHVVHQWSLKTKQSPMQVIGWDEQTVSLDQLPPLPADVSSFSLQVVDLKKGFQRLTELQSQLAVDPEPLISFFNELGMTGVKFSITKPENEEELKEQVGIALSALEPVVCLYNDRKQQLLPCGIPTVAVKVKDQAVLLAQLEKLGWNRDDRWGCPTFYQTANPFQGTLKKSEDNDADDNVSQADAAVNISEKLNFSLGTMTLAICDGWLVGGIQPQTVQTFILRSRGSLPRWTPDNIMAETRTKIPAKFVRLTYDDPRAGIETLASYAPWVRDGMQSLMSGMLAACDVGIKPVADKKPDGPGRLEAGFKVRFASPLDIPPVELVVAPLFPNVSVTTVTGDITRARTYGSTFVQNPVFWTAAAFIGFSIGLEFL